MKQKNKTSSISLIAIIVSMFISNVYGDERAKERLEWKIKRMLLLEKDYSNLPNDVTERRRKQLTYQSAKLNIICKQENLDFRKLSVNDIKYLFKERENEFFGDITEGGKFATLDILCDFIKLHPNKLKLRETINNLFLELPLDIGNSVSWEYTAIISRNGYIGVMADCLIDIGNDEFLIKLIENLIEKKEVERFGILVSQVV